MTSAPRAPRRRTIVSVSGTLVIPDRSLDLLRLGGRIAVVGHDVGAAAADLAGRFPLSSVHGFDADRPAVDAALAAAAAAGVTSRCHFAVASPDDVPAGGYALLLLLDCLYAARDARAIARRATKVIARDGAVVVVERVDRVDPAVLRRVLTASGFLITDGASTEASRVVADTVHEAR